MKTFTFFVYKNDNISSCPTLINCLFGAFSLTKHPDIDQHKYFGCGTGFDRNRFFFHTLVVELVEM